MKNILFVCTGNTCRSSMAEAVAKKLIEERPELKGKLRVSSAGIHALANGYATPQAISVMKEMGIDLKDHRATLLSKDMTDEADLILTMTENHKHNILSAVPKAWTKIHTLKEYAGGGAGDISDPFGQSIEVYRECANEIKDALDKVLEKLDQEDL